MMPGSLLDRTHSKSSKTNPLLSAVSQISETTKGTS